MMNWDVGEWLDLESHHLRPRSLGLNASQLSLSTGGQLDHVSSRSHRQDNTNKHICTRLPITAIAPLSPGTSSPTPNLHLFVSW